jgi:hypothetical protein
MKLTSKNTIQKERLKTAIESDSSSVEKLIQKKPRKNIESKIQSSFIKWFSYQYPQYDKLLFAIPNGTNAGGRKSKNGIPISALKARGEGLKRGVADLFLSIAKIPRDDFYGCIFGLYIETKTEDGRQTPEQKEFQKAVESQGYQYTICRSVDEFIKTINEYL